MDWECVNTGHRRRRAARSAQTARRPNVGAARSDRGEGTRVSPWRHKTAAAPGRSGRRAGVAAPARRATP